MLHYYLLGAWSGLFICIFEVLRDFSYYKTGLDKQIFLGTIIIYILYGILTIEHLIDSLPVIASVVDGISLTGKKKIVIIGAILEYTLWVIYDIAVMSYSGALTDGIIALSNISILLFNKDLLKNDRLKNFRHHFLS